MKTSYCPRARSSFPTLRGVALLLAAVGCSSSGGQTGQGSGAAPACHEQKTALSDPTAAGISSASLQGSSEPLRGSLHFNALDADTALSFEVTRILGAYQLTPDVGQPFYCTDHVEVDVAARLTTADGRLSEELSTTLSGTSTWSFETELDLSALVGSYDGSEFSASELKNPKLVVRGHRDFARFWGSLGLESEDPNPSDSSTPTSPSVGDWSGSAPPASGGSGGGGGGDIVGGTGGSR